MFTTAIKFFFIIFCSIYSFYKILNISFFKINTFLTTFSVSIGCSIIISLFHTNNFFYKILSILIFLFLYYAFILKENIALIFISTLLSFCLSYIFFSIAAFIVSLSIFPFFDTTISLPFNKLTILIGLFQYSFLYFLFQIRRMKKGMPFLINSSIINTGITISVPIISCIIALPSLRNFTFITHLHSLLTILFLALLLMIWWRKRITQTYLERLRTAELESLRAECEEKDKKIKELTDNNDRLAGIIHKDNKLLPAMENAVLDFLSVASAMNETEQKQYGQSLRTQLEEMLLARKNALNHYQNSGAYKSLTGIGILDGVCNHMKQLASTKQITIDFRIHDKLKENIPKNLNIHDIGHLLADLSTNAIHAVEQMENQKKIHIHLGFQKDIFIVEVKDSGIEFDPSVYNDLGLKQHTTHKENGGSGIGLMDIWKLKQKYNASIHIQEYSPSNNDFTKKISVLFDTKNLFLLSSYRCPVINNIISRNDIFIFPYSETK